MGRSSEGLERKSMKDGLIGLIILDRYFPMKSKKKSLGVCLLGDMRSGLSPVWENSSLPLLSPVRVPQMLC